jgi:5'-3' exonuclease
LYQLLVFPEVFFVKVNSMKDGMELFGKEDFKSKYELEPEQWLDYKTLVGDASDNLKGVPGIGPKTATKILHKIGCLYNLFTHLGLDASSFSDLGLGFEGAKEFVNDPVNKTVCDKIIENSELLKQTYFLATLQNVPGTEISFSGFDFSLGLDDFQRFNFKSLINAANKFNVIENQQEALF